MESAPIVGRFIRMILVGGLITVTVGCAVSQSQSTWQTVEMIADEYRFVPNRIQVKANKPLELVIRNKGNEPHRFQSSLFRDQMLEVVINESVVRGPNIERVDIIPGGEVRIKILSAPAGEFDFQCRIPSHHGMDGILIIQ